jgi:hypothetical protein
LQGNGTERKTNEKYMRENGQKRAEKDEIEGAIYFGKEIETEKQIRRERERLQKRQSIGEEIGWKE